MLLCWNFELGKTITVLLSLLRLLILHGLELIDLRRGCSASP